MPRIYVLDLPEFSPVVAAAQSSDCVVSGPLNGYWKVEKAGTINFNRKALGLSAALWNTSLAGGVVGRITQFNSIDCTIEEA